MEYIFAFLEKISKASGIKAVYIHVAFKTVGAIAGTYIIWIILKRILASIEKKPKQTVFLKSMSKFSAFSERRFFMV